MRAFTETDTTDQKRLARGEQLLLARSLLRARDEKHNCAWRVLILAGRYPQGEISAVQELMPQARILAIDNDPVAVQAAAACGVEAMQVDLGDFAWREGGKTRNRSDALPNQQVMKWTGFDDRGRHRGFDLIHLDFCGTVMGEAHDIIPVYMSRRALTLRGVFIASFSYGREVAEVLMSNYYHGHRPGLAQEAWEDWPTLPELLKTRLSYIIAASRVDQVRSIVSYQGSRMPMCSMLVSMTPWKQSYIHIGPHDLKAAIVNEQLNLKLLYDTPEERILAFRRSMAAQKAVVTRRKRQSMQLMFPSPDDSA